MSEPISYSPPGPPPDRGVKVPHLVFALLFLGIAAVWALVITEVVTADGLSFLAPGVLIVAGVIGLVAGFANNRNRRRASLHRPSPEEGSPAANSHPEHTRPLPRTEHDPQHDPEHDEPTQEIR